MQVAIISIIIETQAEFCVCFPKINSKLCSGKPKLPLIPKVGSSTNTKKLFLWLSAWDDELLSAPKIITFLAVSLPKLD